MPFTDFLNSLFKTEEAQKATPGNRAEADKLLNEYSRQKSLENEISTKYPELIEQYGKNYYQKPLNDIYRNIKDVQVPENLPLNDQQQFLLDRKRELEDKMGNYALDKILHYSDQKLEDKNTFGKALADALGVKVKPQNEELYKAKQALDQRHKTVQEKPDLSVFQRESSIAGSYNPKQNWIRIASDGKLQEDLGALVHEYGHFLSSGRGDDTDTRMPKKMTPLEGHFMTKTRDNHPNSESIENKVLDNGLLLKSIPTQNLLEQAMRNSANHFDDSSYYADKNYNYYFVPRENKKDLFGEGYLSFPFEYPARLVKDDYTKQGLEQGLPEEKDKFQELKSLFDLYNKR